MFLFADDMTLYIENSKETTKNLLELVNKFSKLQDTTFTYRNVFYFYILMTNYQKGKLRKLLCLKLLSCRKMAEE